jgi:hypothetical protein
MHVGKLFSIMFSVGLMLGLASAAVADSDSVIVRGIPAGDKFEATCPDGQAAVGFVYNAAESLTAIGTYCAKVENGKISGSPIKPKSIRGVKRGKAFAASLCTDANAVAALLVVQNGLQLIRHIQILCREDLAGAGYDHGANQSLVDLPAQQPGLGNGFPPNDPLYILQDGAPALCPEATYATGFIGTYLAGQSITSIGLRCSDPVTADKPQADTTKPDNGSGAGGDMTDPGDGASDGEDGFQITLQIGPNTLKFGPKGKVRKAKEATTVYAEPDGDEIAYLDKGEKVTVLACEDKGKGWCQVTRPEAGFVWGGDLK